MNRISCDGFSAAPVAAGCLTCPQHGLPLSLSGAVGEVTLPTRQKDKNHLTQKPFGIFQPNSTFSSFPEESLFNVKSLPVDMTGGRGGDGGEAAFHPQKTVSSDIM